MVKATSVYAFLMCVLVGALQLSPSFGQARDSQGDQGNQVVIDLSRLPSLLELERTVPGWSSMDSSVAVGLVQKWLQEHHKDYPIDCKFKLSDPIQRRYGDNEYYSVIENNIRRGGTPVCAIRQLNVWTDFPSDRPEFNPEHATHPSWIKFKTEFLPKLEEQMRVMYQSPPPADIRMLTINGYSDVCNDIKYYLHKRFKVDPGFIKCVDEPAYLREFSSQIQTMQSGNSPSTSIGAGRVMVYTSHAIRYYKMTSPYADGYEYRTIEVTSCQFEEEEKKLETPIDMRINKVVANADPTEKQKIIVPEKELTPRQERQLEKERKRKEKEDFKAWERKSAEESRRYNEEQKRKLDEDNRKIQERAPKFVYAEDPSTTEVTPTTDVGRTLLKGYHDAYKTPWQDLAAFGADEKKLNDLLEKVKKGETEFDEQVHKKYPDYDTKIESVELDSEEPFDVINIPVDFPLNSDELPQMVKYLTGKGYPWIVGCRVRSLVHKDENGKEISASTVVSCMVPRFLVAWKDPTPEKTQKTIHVPMVGNVIKAVTNQCGVEVGTTIKKGLVSKEIPLYKKSEKSSGKDPSYIAGKLRDYPKEIIVYAGIKGKVLDLVTKLPVQNADVTVAGLAEVYSKKTSTAGGYLFEQLRMKGLERHIHGHHRLYRDGSISIEGLKFNIVSQQVDMLLDPIRVTVSGDISETRTPRFGTGLKGLKVYVKGYTEFTALTDEKGHYVIKNVPVTIPNTTIVVEDTLGGHQPGEKKVTLDPDRPAETVDIAIIPNLTTIKGRVTIPSGKPADGMVISIPGYRDLKSTSDLDGNYEIEDIPITVKELNVNSTDESVYGSKVEPVSGLQAWKMNPHDIVVKYLRTDVSGIVYDVLTKEPIQGITVTIDGSGGKLKGVTNASGFYEIRKVPDTARSLTPTGTATKYIVRSKLLKPQPVAGEDLPNQDIALVPRSYTANRIVFVLTWNDKQSDLDSQLFLPDGKHLFFKTLSDNSFHLKGGANLDKDDTGKAGRETTVIALSGGKTKIPGEFRFLVFQYVDDGLKFSEAGAVVEIYRDGQFWKEITPGPGKGRLWYVASINNANISVKDKFPAGDLYEEIDELQRELKANLDSLNDFEGQTNSIINQFSTLQANRNKMSEAYNQKSERVKVLMEPPAGNPVNKPVVDSLGNRPVQPIQPTQQPAAKQETPQEELARLKKEMADLDAQIKRADAQLKSLDAQIKTRQVSGPALKEKMERRAEEIRLKNEELDKKLEKILEAYH
ncbi:MAG: hypothetical protein JST80_06450 [Bdellovibrionales bacterium]|nr:hypothetical protein [Bdellovibrionales bacterium]